MGSNYEDIVRNWYTRFRPEFLRVLTHRYPDLTLSEAESLYQDTFLAIQENLKRGRIQEGTSWGNYIITLGLNLVNKENRRAKKLCPIDDTTPEEEEDIPFSKDPEAQSILGDALAHTPEPCTSIIRLFYYDEKSMDDIAETVGFKNAQTAKAKKSQCMDDLIRRVTQALRRADFDVIPKKWRKNG